ncbi:hypothetical protein DRB96_18365 [Streptomyces sp. ICC1]|nr:hypothetical protein DRB96_18365 [Streptomyces sp. ICC1]
MPSAHTSCPASASLRSMKSVPLPTATDLTMLPICGTSVYAAQVASRSLKGQPSLNIRSESFCDSRKDSPPGSGDG